MKSVQSITLGQPPKDPNQGDERVANAMKILELGFPDGVIAVCSSCNALEELGLDEAAVMIVDHTWPCCHEKKMLMDDPANAPSF